MRRRGPMGRFDAADYQAFHDRRARRPAHPDRLAHAVRLRLPAPLYIRMLCGREASLDEPDYIYALAGPGPG